MSRTYRATGINLKSTPLGESDRILTILTRDRGLVRAIAAGSRKANSSLGGRCGLFVVNELLLAKGKSLDRLTQAEAIATYSGLSRDLGRLTASQYLAELVLAQTSDDRPDPQLFELVLALLDRLNTLPDRAAPTTILATLCAGIVALLDFAGFTPQVQTCRVTHRLLTPDVADRSWRAGFNFQAGGAIDLVACRQLQQQREPEIRQLWDTDRDAAIALRLPTPDRYLNATDLVLLQHLAHGDSFEQHFEALTLPHLASAWIRVEQVLRHYAQYHLSRGIASATLLDSYASAALAVPPAEAICDAPHLS